jgi:uncharacterized PurR-regulated membrane protein YhhQ (DUF165 family)
MNTKLLAALYIAANAAANLILIAVPLSFRAGASVAIAATFVALDITTRDALHDVWHGDRRRLGALIVGGALCSALINLAAWPVAVASCAAFLAAGVADTLVYAALIRSPWYARTNASNVASAVIDSAVFLGLAAVLGVLPWFAVAGAFAGQVIAKSAGGALWAWVLARRGHAG